MPNSKVIHSFIIHFILMLEYIWIFCGCYILHKVSKSHIEDKAEGLWRLRGLDQATLWPCTLGKQSDPLGCSFLLYKRKSRNCSVFKAPFGPISLCFWSGMENIPGNFPSSSSQFPLHVGMDAFLCLINSTSIGTFLNFYSNPQMRHC